MMTAQDVREVVDCLQRAGIQSWLDGGWGVDALLGEQTRDHDDLDCVISLDDADPARDSLAALGFVVAEDELPTRFVVRDMADRRVDFHTVTFDEKGGGVQRLQDGTSWRYPSEGFLATGRVGGRLTPCLTADVQLLSHIGYEPDEKDSHDLRLLADHFALELPAPYREKP